MTWAIAVFFSTMLAGPATNYNVPKAVECLAQNHNNYDFFVTTAGMGNYLYAMPDLEQGESQKFLYSVAEQRVFADNLGNVILVATKFGAPNQWLMVMRDIEFSSYTVIGSTTQPFDAGEKFAIATDPKAVAAYAIKKCAAIPGLAYKLYAGPAYTKIEDEISFRFKL